MRFVFTCHGLICEIWMQHKNWIFNYCSTHVHGSKCRKYTAKFGFCTLQCSILITYPCKVATAAILIQTRCVQSVFSLKKITVGSSDCHTAQYKNPMQQCTKWPQILYKACLRLVYVQNWSLEALLYKPRWFDHFVHCIGFLYFRGKRHLTSQQI